MFGNCAIGKSAIEIAPTTTVRIAITIATMGRRMKKLAIISAPRFLCTAWDSPVRLLCFLCANRHNAFSRLQARCDHPERAHSRPDLYRTELRPTIGADHSDLIRSLLLIHRRLWHQQRSRDVSGRRLNACILARSQKIPGVRGLTYNLDGSSLRVYLAIREDDSARMRVDTPIRQS